MDEHDLEDQVALLAGRVRNDGAEAAEAALRERRPAIAEEVIAEFRRRLGKPFVPPTGVVAADLGRWYVPRPDHEAHRWVHVRSVLGEHLPPEVVAHTSEVADQIVARLGDPTGEQIRTRGLVLGHVQSGKTTSFLSVAAKAIDAGYHLVIILAGVHNSLRRQTQDRAARTLLHKRNLWWLGTEVSDFRPDGNPLASHLAGDGKRGLLVVKKHSTILGKLADWLEESTDADLREMAILVIDDEADQAGLDVSRGSELEGVHKQLRRVVDLQTSDGHRRCAYLAYTATPYANILTSQAEYGLYPRDFIYPLDKPEAYMGSEELFGERRVGRPIRIEEDDSGELMTDSLRDAVRWFVLATAARAGLGTPLEEFHSSMLVHTTQKTEDQKLYKPAIEAFLAQLAAEFESDPTAMRDAYEAELARVPAREAGGDGFVEERVAPWDDVAVHVPAVLERLIERTPSGDEFVEDGRTQRAHSGVIVDNSKVDSVDRLTYSDLGAGQPSVTVIAIGGNTLSRGLTLEGLTCSYFARTARTYDSLMQMGRWFGYRPGYRHLIRIWTTQVLFEWFQELDLVEQELRDELIWMQDNELTPDAYGPRIRLSPHMNITRAAAMRSIDRDVSYANHVVDPAWLDLDPDALLANQAAARTLAEGLGTASPVGAGSLLFTGVPSEKVRTFLREFRFHAEEKRIDAPTLFSYLDRESEHLQEWNVIVKSTASGSRSTIDLGGDVGVVNTAVRAQKADSSRGFIQSLVDSKDHRLDFGGAPPADGSRFRGIDEPPLLVVYAIDAESPSRSADRVALNADSTPLSISLALPRSASFVQYARPVVADIDQATAQIDLGDHDDD